MVGLNAFDFCHTLYRANTTYDFVLFALRVRGWRFRYLIARIISTKPASLLLCKLNRDPRRILVGMLKGIHRQELSNMADKFIDWLDASCQNVEVFNRFKNSLAMDECETIVISASVSPVLEAFQNKYKVTTYSSSMAYDEGGVFLGNILCYLGGNKHRIASQYKCSHVLRDFYSDNLEDIDTGVLFSNYYFIVRNKRHLKKFRQVSKVKGITDVIVCR